MTILNLVPEKLSANGKTNETDCGFTQEGFSYIAEKVALSLESIILKTLTQNAITSDWAMDVNMDQCGITPKSDNTSIYFPLTIQSESTANAVIYRETPDFKIGFKCYFQREMKFSGGGWKVISENITDVTLGMANHCRRGPMNHRLCSIDYAEYNSLNYLFQR